MAQQINSNASYKVGYGRPPTATQYRKGQSGNPSGKRRDQAGKPPPAASGGLSAEEEAVLGVMREPVSLDDKVRGKRVTRLEAIFRALADQAACGDVRAVKLVLEAHRLASAAEERLRRENEARSRASPEFMRRLTEFILQERRGSPDLPVLQPVDGEDQGHARAGHPDTAARPVRAANTAPGVADGTECTARHASPDPYVTDRAPHSPNLAPRPGPAAPQSWEEPRRPAADRQRSSARRRHPCEPLVAALPPLTSTGYL